MRPTPPPPRARSFAGWPPPASPTPTLPHGPTSCTPTTRPSCSASRWSMPGSAEPRADPGVGSRRAPLHASLSPVYHIELRQFPHNMCRFNLSEPQLATLVLPWVREEWIELGERKWNPNQATLKIVEGPELPLDQLTMGRGWRHA